jgi:putative ABC transport system permease protein
VSADRPSLRDRLSALWRRPAQNVEDELRFHLEMRMDEARRAGMTEEQARASVMQRFGSYSSVEGELIRIDSARERRRDRREMFDDVRRDVIFAMRSLRRAPAFAFAALATLAVAIGANTAIYSVVHALLLAPLPFRDADRLVTPWFGTLGELDAMRPRWRSAEHVVASSQLEVNFDDGVSARIVQAAAVSDSFFNVLGVTPQLGRVFTDEESVPGKTGVVLLSDGLWRRQFGADSSVLGRSISVDGGRRTIVGVMPRSFDYPSDVEFWVPARMDRAIAANMWTSAGFLFVARLRPGVAIETARAELDRVMLQQVRRLNPVWDPGPTYTQGLAILPIRDAIVGQTRDVLEIVMGCALLVLLIACINVANLLLARSTARQRELTVRAALGGGRGRLIRQLLTESVILSSIGAIAGVALAAAGIRWLVASLPREVTGRAGISVDGPALAFALLLAVITGLAFGALPAFRATRAGATDGLVRSGRGSRGPGHQRITALLVAGEIALAVLVVTSAQLLVRSFAELRSLDPGFKPARVVTARVTPAATIYGDVSRSDALFATLTSRLSALPGVREVALVSALPLARPARGVAMRVQGRFEDGRQRLPWANHLHIVTPSYFHVLGIPIRKGRGFTSDDRRESTPVVIVSEDVARALWPGQDPLGKRIGWPYESPWMTVIGVVPDVKVDNMRDTTMSSIYVPFLQRPLGPDGRARTDYTIVAKAAREDLDLDRSFREVIRSTDRSIPVSAVQSLDEVVRESTGSMRFTASLVSAFALVALFLGAIGIYGVMSYLVGQRAQELSVRAALGASTAELHGVVLRRATAVAIGGAAAGIALALVATRPLRTLLYGISNLDPLTLTTVPILFLVIALMASLGPARRAARSSPASALRAD